MFLPLPSVLSQGRESCKKCLCAHLKTALFVSYGPRGLLNAEPWWLLESVTSEPVPRVTAAKLGALYVWALSFQEEAGNLFVAVVVVEMSQRENVGQVPTSFLGLLGGSQPAPRNRLIRSQTLMEQLGNCALKILPGRNEEMVIFAWSVCAEPREDLWGVFNNCFFVWYSPVGLMNAKPCWLPELRDLGTHASHSRLKPGALDVWSKPFTHREAGSCGFPPNHKALCQGWGVWCVSQPFLPTFMWVFSQ